MLLFFISKGYCFVEEALAAISAYAAAKTSPTKISTHNRETRWPEIGTKVVTSEHLIPA
jgi:hypothetical protein